MSLVSCRASFFLVCASTLLSCRAQKHSELRLSTDSPLAVNHAVTCDVLDFSGRDHMAPGLEVNRCSSVSGYDQLRIEVIGSKGPTGVTGRPFAMNGEISVFVRLNGQEVTVPMACTRAVSGSNGATGRCLATISNQPNPVLRDDEGPSTNVGLFTYARPAVGSNMVNAWDIAVAFVNEHGEWDSRGGMNYVTRFSERRLD